MDLALEALVECWEFVKNGWQRLIRKRGNEWKKQKPNSIFIF